MSNDTKQSDDSVTLVNNHKAMEELMLRHLDYLARQYPHVPGCDPRWLQVARTHFEQGFMALNRSVFRPKRVDHPRIELLERAIYGE